MALRSGCSAGTSKHVARGAALLPLVALPCSGCPVEERSLAPNLECTDRSCACAADWGDCDQDLGNGCEASLRTDARHCGVCGHDCLGGGCENGMCSPLVVTEIAVPTGVLMKDFGFALGSTHLFWRWLGANEVTNSVVAMPLEGGDGEIVAPAEASVDCLAVRGTTAYWLARGGSNALQLRAVTLGQAPRTIAELGPLFALGQGDHTCLDVSDELDFALLRPETVGDPGQLYQIRLDTGAFEPRFPVNTDCGRLVASAGRLTWAEASNDGQMQLRTVELPAGEPTTLVSGLSDSYRDRRFAVDAEHSYFAGAAASLPPFTVFRVGFDGSPPDALIQLDTVVADVTVDGSRLYFTESDVGSVAAIPVEGGSRSVLASGQHDPTELSLTDDAIYWLTEWRIMKLAK